MPFYKKGEEYNKLKVDCHDFACAKSRNDGVWAFLYFFAMQNTHPQTTSAREGALYLDNSTSQGMGDLWNRQATTKQILPSRKHNIIKAKKVTISQFIKG